MLSFYLSEKDFSQCDTNSNNTAFLTVPLTASSVPVPLTAAGPGCSLSHAILVTTSRSVWGAIKVLGSNKN